MPRLALGSRTRGGYEYAIDVDIDDAALVDDKLAFKVVAKRRPRPAIGPGQVVQRSSWERSWSR